ncbi:MAG: hypothetical protein IKB87_02910 [Clostridia bacterium]|nr:hypothetical protein [Clostridia bacterium]
MDEKETLISRLKQHKKIALIVILAVAGMMLIISGNHTGNTKPIESTEVKSNESIYFYTEELEKRIATLCKEIKGVSEAHVLITLDGGSEFVYAEDIAGAAREYVIIEGKEEGGPILIQEIYPEIRGVAVVCTRGNDSEMQRIITELLSAALGISSSRIRVAGT